MGLFSLFKKTDTPATAGDGAPAPPEQPDADAEARALALQRQREVAHATALKIDAIESAMAADIFNDSAPPWSNRPPVLSAPAPQAPDSEWMDDEPAAAPAAEQAPLVEEGAMLYAAGQDAAAAALLAGAARPGASRERAAWWMLLDLYQASGRQERFEDLAIDYASTFETSPPSWNPPAPAAPAGGVLPTAALSGMLDEQAAPALDRLLAAGHPVLRLELGRVAGVAPAGCTLLLQALRKLQDGGRELVLAGAEQLAARLAGGLRVGRREDSQAPWLLYLELLLLLRREREFEQTAMDYCITYEVSPPSYTAPARPVASAPQQRAQASDRFLLPPEVLAPASALLDAIQEYAERYPVLVFDCSRLLRMDMAAANQLLTRLQALSGDGRRIEFRDINHLVAALLRLLGFSAVARIYPHKY